MIEFVEFGDLVFFLKTKLVNATSTDVRTVRVFNTIRMFNGPWGKLSQETDIFKIS